MNRRKADLLGYKDHPYDALLDEYEPGSTTKDVQALFSDLSRSLTVLLEEDPERYSGPRCLPPWKL